MKYLPLNKPCLKWKSSFQPFEFLIQNHIARTMNAFQALCKHGNLLSPAIQTAWLELPTQKQLFLLLNPDAAEIIFAAKEDPKTAAQSGLGLQLEDLIANVLARSDAAYVHPRHIHWNEPLLTSNGIRVDVKGMLHSLGNPKINAPSEERSQFYLAQIEKAMVVIREVSPFALSLIENFTNTIHIRENPFHPNYSSWSNHIGIGKITASNFHDVADDLAEVIDFLIHESIHNFLHLVEEEYGPFLEASAFSTTWIKEKFVPSPWSGKLIDLGSYTHAILVWYGLAQFWLQARDYQGALSKELTPQRVQKMINQASEGFLKERNVHLVTGERFAYLNKDFLAFSLDFQTEIMHLNREAAHA